MSAKPEPFWIARLAAGHAARLRNPGESVEDYRIAMGWDKPRVDLTDEQIHSLWVLNGGSLNGNNYVAFARAVLAEASIHKSEPFTPLNGAGEAAATHYVNEHGEAEQLFDCEGITLESNKPFAFKCCDCGLTHHMVIVSEDCKPVGFAVKRVAPTSTAASGVAVVCHQPFRTEGTDALLAAARVVLAHLDEGVRPDSEAIEKLRDAVQDANSFHLTEPSGKESQAAR
jgi:hypothetical protein